jgi:hypothetical protein
VAHEKETAPVGGLLPGHVNPELSLGTLIGYSGLLGKLISAAVSIKTVQVGESIDLPVFESYVPGGQEGEFAIHYTRKR